MMINNSHSSPNLRSVAIIGSGLAGLTAALLLQKTGRRVTVFEKSRGPGGRLAAKRVEGGSADIGAQYFTIRNPGFQQFLDENAGTDSYASWNGHFGYQVAPEQWEPFPDEARYVGVPRMTAITRALSEKATVIAQTRIARLETANHGAWTLVSTDDERFGPFDAVVITAPPAQAQDLLTDSQLVTLAAELDEPVRHVQPCWAVAAHFSHPPFDQYDGMRVQSDILSWAGNNSSKPGRDDAGQWWVLHATSAWSRANVDTPAEQVASDMIREFQDATGSRQQPDKLLTHRWLYAKSSDSDTPGHRWFPDQRIGLAGDWLSGGRVEGAFNSASGLVDEMGILSD